jgi:hypothetical protein
MMTRPCRLRPRECKKCWWHRDDPAFFSLLNGLFDGPSSYKSQMETTFRLVSPSPTAADRVERQPLARNFGGDPRRKRPSRRQ